MENTIIEKYYNKKAEVIYPPVDTKLFYPENESGDYYSVVSAFVPYKRIDLAIKTFNKLNKKLIIIGDGPEKKRLMKLAKSNITFIDWLP